VCRMACASTSYRARRDCPLNLTCHPEEPGGSLH
jgi:hypothetical protein